MTAPPKFFVGSEVPIHDVSVTTVPYPYADPADFRLEPHGTLPYDWTRKDG